MKRTIGFAVVTALLALTGTASAARLSVTDAWSRPAVGTGVVYLTLTNGSSQRDALVGARSPIAAHVELHESMSTAGPMGGIASMQHVRFIAVSARGRVVLRPGGYHIMLIGLKRSLKAAMTFPLELDFEHAGWTTVRVHVHEMD